MIPYFGAYDLAKLEAEAEQVDRFVAAKIREGLAPKTVWNLLVDLDVVLKQAVRWRLMRSNPVRDAERPRVETPETQVLTQAGRAPAFEARVRSSAAGSGEGQLALLERRGGGSGDQERRYDRQDRRHDSKRFLGD